MSRQFFLDGVLVAAAGVALGLKSPGLAYGFGVFETIRFRKRRACFLNEHFARLQRAAAGAGLAFSLSLAELERQLGVLFEVNAAEEGVFKIIVSGTESGSRVAVFIRDVGLDTDAKRMRVRVSEVRKASAAFTSRHKTLNYMENLLELRAAKASGFDECLFTNEVGFLTELSMSNVCFVSGGVLKTPALSCGLLDGIVRGAVLEIAAAAGLPVEEGAYTLEDLAAASEVFATNSGAGTVSIELMQAGGREFAFRETAVADRLRVSILEREEEGF